MRIKVFKSKELKKAMDRSKLVLVDVQVNGRNGAYRSKRWKNPGTALSIVKEDIKKQAKFLEGDAEVHFKNKSTNEIVNDSDITKEYLSNPKNKSLTLQAYVAKNYKPVVKNKPEDKVNNKVENEADNKTDNKEVKADFLNSENLVDLKDKEANKTREGYINLLRERTKDYVDYVKENGKNNESIKEYNRLSNLGFSITINKDPYFWKTVDKNLSPEDLFEYVVDSDVLFVDSDLNAKEADKVRIKAYIERHSLIASYLKARKNGTISIKDMDNIQTVLYGTADANFYIDMANANLRNDKEKLEYCKKEYERRNELAEMQIKKEEKPMNWGLLKRYGTKKLEAKQEYKRADNFDSLRGKLSELKGFHTDTVLRAAADMAGLDVPVYVKRKGKPLNLGRSKVAGYCEYSLLGDVREIAVVDKPHDRAFSYKTTVHEMMHGLLADTKDANGSIGVRLPLKYNEGIVEMVGQTSMKKAYGKEYKERDRRTYKDFVVETCLKLKQMEEFKGKTISQIADRLGDSAFNRDDKFLSKVEEHLNKLKKQRLSDLAKDYTDTDKMEKACKDRYAAEHGGDMTNFEKTELAMLVDRIKHSDFTLEDALKSGRYQSLAVVLLYNILDEEDDELLGLL